MVKGNPKASASSATRKKHAKKGAPPEEPQVRPKTKGGKKNAKEPRIKMYIPPVKPAPVQPDPLETTGLAHSLPANLLVILRTINKKAQVTKIRALEDLQRDWVDKCLKEGEQSELVFTLVEMLPVWLHHAPSLFVNSSRRVRAIAASLHASFLQIPAVHDQIIFFLRETASVSQSESILGTWCLAAYDVDRQVAAIASKTWKEAVTLDENTTASLHSFVQRTALDPSGVYAYLNPIPPPATLPAVKRGGVASSVSTPGGDQTPRSKTDEQEESEQDRSARLRIGALGAARWLLSLTSTLSEEFYSNPALWTALHSGEACPWMEMESFGFGQPNVRKAGWSLLQSLLATHKDALPPLLPTIGVAVLRSAWVELDTMVQAVMWQPLLTFIRQFPQSWTLDVEENGEDEGEGETSLMTSQAYQEFLQFLQLGCSGSPVQGYPAVVLIVSTIPSSIMISESSPLTQFFSSFWAAVDGRALSSLHRVAASAAFLSSLLECMVFLVKRMWNTSARSDGDTSASGKSGIENLVKDQLLCVWTDMSSKRLKVEERAAARLIGRTLESLYEVEESLFHAGWETLANAIKESSEKAENSLLVSAVLKVFFDRFKDGSVLKQVTDLLLMEVLLNTVGRCEVTLRQPFEDPEGEDKSQPSLALLLNMMEQFREGLFFDQGFSFILDRIVVQHSYDLLSRSPMLLLAYLIHRKDESKCLDVWHSLLSKIASSSGGAQQAPNSKAIGSLLEAAQNGRLPKYLKPQDGELDSLIGDLLEKALSGPMNSDESLLLKRIMLSPEYFLSPSGYNTFLQVIIATFTSNAKHVVEGQAVESTVFDVSIYFIEAIFTTMLKDEALTKSLLPEIFLFAYLLPICAATEAVDAAVTPSVVAAKGLWEAWLKLASEDQKADIGRDVKVRLKIIVQDTSVHPLPRDVLQVLYQKPAGLQADVLNDIFPSSSALDDLLDALSPDPMDSSLVVLDNILPTTPTSAVRGKVRTPASTDRVGFAPYARVVNGLLQAFVDDRQLAKRNLWALRHFLSLSIYAQDLQNVPPAFVRSSVFDGKITAQALDDVVAKTKQVSVYLFNSFAGQEDDTWRRVVVERALNEVTGKDVKVGLTEQQRFLFDVIVFALKDDLVRDARVLKMVLEPLLKDGVDVDEADLWVQLARKLERAAPQTAMTIISAITSTGAEPPKLDRYRNELAASLLGIKPQKVNTEGLFTLRKLAASAPDPESDVAFLPTTRAVNVIKACQAWVVAEGNDDDEEDEMDVEVESSMLPIFMHLAPILQNIPGAHWAFVFDVLEGVLERASGADNDSEAEGEPENDNQEDGATLVALARSLRLVIVLEDLAARNKSLMAEWSERRTAVLVVIRDLELLKLEHVDEPSAPQSACRELVLSIVQHLPPSLIDQDTLPKMVHLLEDPVPKVQRMAYQLLKTAAKKRTEHFVIEAGVDTEGDVQATLPAELLEIVQRDMNFSPGYGADHEAADGEDGQNMFGYLLGWMLVFDLFQDASFKVKSSYIDQLRNSEVVLEHFIPCFLGLLRLNQGGLVKTFKLDVWGVDAFYVDLYEPGRPHTIPVLVAHVYYRALLSIPSLIHGWVLDCKDRQLTNTVISYTSTYFSPVIIRAELEHVRSNAAAGVGLTDDSMSVKVAPSVNEVMAAYSVDDHQLEIKIRIPSDWPLHRVEVKDVKRVGVDENRWRAWVLGVQQTIWAHNGRIVDGLTLFKKNVTLHFEGQVECAICYSIISVMDGSLPKKPCKTCKNRFHAGCLYKWFNTSHSSSCPLCRSDII